MEVFSGFHTDLSLSFYNLRKVTIREKSSSLCLCLWCIIFFLEHAGELRIFVLREEKSPITSTSPHLWCIIELTSWGLRLPMALVYASAF
jgi:hypothetical protein